MRRFQNIMVTGGCGFVGSSLIRQLFRSPDFHGKIINVDLLTYAADPSSLSEVADEYLRSRYYFENIDISDYNAVYDVFTKYDIDAIVHFAAESHVDRSIQSPRVFIESNIVGTFNLLEAARTLWGFEKGHLFHHVSTDEVFGMLGESGQFSEHSPYNPSSPYSASKASSDHLVKAYHKTYDLPVTVSNCSNNYGPYQHREKFIPLMIENMVNRRPLPVYGDGKNVRSWIYVEDHTSAIYQILKYANAGETYIIGGDNECTNIALVDYLCDIVAGILACDSKELVSLIANVTDRAGHDFRYAVDDSKIKKDLGWEPVVKFRDGLERTARW